MADKLWSPEPADIALTAMTRFTRHIEAKYEQNFADYNQLHAWSISQAESFWDELWSFVGIEASCKATTTVDDLQRFPGASWFPGAELNFAENLLVERSDKTALICLLENGRRQTLSYLELYQQVECIASQLRSLQLSPGDRVAAWLPNTAEAIVTMLATSSLGGVFSSCSPDFGSQGALDRFSQIKPTVLVAANGYYYAGKTIDIQDKVREVAAKLPSVKAVVWIDTLDAGITLLQGEALWTHWLEKSPEPLTFAQLSFDHPLYILYSSGTTGKPKCIVHGQGGTLLQHKKEHQLHLNLNANDTLFFFTTCGWMMWNWMVSALASRCTLVLYDGSPMHPSPGAMFDICEGEKVTAFGISAKFLSMAQQAAIKPAQTHQLDQLRMLLSTGSPLTTQSFSYVYEDIKADCHLVSMSGGTDIVSCFMLGNPNLPVYTGELQCAGLGMAVEIWDEDGHSLPTGKGELVCTQAFPACPIGFWDDPEQHAYRKAYFDIYPDVWVHGDYAARTEHDGYVIFGRSDATLNPGGVRIGTAEIYTQLADLSEIADAVCVGQTWLDDTRVVLFVVMASGQTLTPELSTRIKSHIRQNISPRHVPAKIIAVNDIPRTLSGKIAEIAVRKTIHGETVTNTSALANPEALDCYVDLPELKS